MPTLSEENKQTSHKTSCYVLLGTSRYFWRNTRTIWKAEYYTNQEDKSTDSDFNIIIFKCSKEHSFLHPSRWFLLIRSRDLTPSIRLTQYQSQAAKTCHMKTADLSSKCRIYRPMFSTNIVTNSSESSKKNTGLYISCEVTVMKACNT